MGNSSTSRSRILCWGLALVVVVVAVFLVKHDAWEERGGGANPPSRADVVDGYYPTIESVQEVGEGTTQAPEERRSASPLQGSVRNDVTATTVGSEPSLLLNLYAKAPATATELNVRVAIEGHTIAPVRTLSRVLRLAESEESMGGVAGRLEMDLSPLARSFLKPGGELSVHCEAQGCAASDLRLVTAQAQWDPDRPGYVLSAEITLEPIRSVHGRVVDVGGKPVGDANVMLCTSENSYNSAEIVSITTTGSDGVFGFQVSSEGVLWIQAFHELYGTAEPVPVLLEIDTDIGEIALRGGTIAGRVYGIAPHLLPKGLQLLLYYPADLPPGHQAFSVGPASVVSYRGVFEPSVRTVVADVSGDFRFTGLLDHGYRLLCMGPEGTCSAAGRSATWHEVRPGEEDLVVQYEGPLLVFEVRGPDGLLNQASCRIEADDFSAICKTGPEGIVRWELPEAAEAKVEISAEAHVSQTILVPALSTADVEYHRVVLQPIQESQMLLNVHCDERPITYIGVAFYREGDPTPFRIENAASPQGEFSFAVEPGAYEVRVRQGNWRNTASFLVEAVLDVEIHPGKNTPNDVELADGGRLRVKVIDGQGHLVDASCEIKDVAGRSISVTYMSLNQSTKAWSENPRRPHSPAVGEPTWAEVVPALPEGQYSAAITADGWISRLEPFVIKRGAITELVARLDPE